MRSSRYDEEKIERAEFAKNPLELESAADCFDIRGPNLDPLGRSGLKERLGRSGIPTKYHIRVGVR